MKSVGTATSSASVSDINGPLPASFTLKRPEGRRQRISRRATLSRDDLDETLPHLHRRAAPRAMLRVCCIRSVSGSRSWTPNGERSAGGSAPGSDGAGSALWPRFSHRRSVQVGAVAQPSGAPRARKCRTAGSQAGRRRLSQTKMVPIRDSRSARSLPRTAGARL